VKTPSPSRGLVIAVVDPTTLLGRDLRAVLSERAFPASRTLLFQTRSDEGLLTSDDDEAAFVAPISPDALESVRVAFFCGKAADTARFLSRRTTDGCLAIDLSGVRTGGTFVRPFEGPGSVPLPDGDLLLTYEPIAAVLAEAVSVVQRLAPVVGVTAAIDRPASELGKDALDELFGQAIALARFESPPKEVFGAQSAFNVHVPPDTGDFEARVAEDVARLIGRPLPVGLLSARSGVFHGHFLRVELRTEGAAPAAEAVRAAFRRSGAFEETDPANLAGPVDAAGRDETLLLHVAASGGSVRIGMAADHLRRTGAVMAVKLAEQAVRERGLLADA
jgi:aspartate-semialdehyde dehydrogenase